MLLQAAADGVKMNSGAGSSLELCNQCILEASPVPRGPSASLRAVPTYMFDAVLALLATG
eukprot:2337724-Amphidinium_carterae.1